MVSLWSCGRFTAEPKPELSKRCFMEPDPGPCKALIKSYYYDAETKSCKEFNYGGCQGVQPFKTLEECKKACGCD